MTQNNFPLDEQQYNEIVNNEENFRIFVVQTLVIMEAKLSKLEEDIDSIAKDVEELKQD